MKEEKMFALMNIAETVLASAFKGKYELDDVCWGENEFSMTVMKVDKRIEDYRAVGTFYFSYDESDVLSAEEQLRERIRDFLVCY